MSLLTTSCVKQETVDASLKKQEANAKTDQLTFTLNPSTDYSNSATTQLRALNTKAGDLLKIYIDSTCSTLISEKTATRNILDFPLSFSSEDSYHFYYRLYDENFNSSDCFSTEVTYTYDISPPLGASIIKVNSSLTSVTSNIQTPQMAFYGVETGDTLYIYTNSNCSIINTTIKVTATNMFFSLSKKIEIDGTYPLYYKIKDKADNYKSIMADTCINTGLNYTYDSIIPNIPSSISLENANPIDNEATITLRFNDLAVGDKIRIYKSSTCSGSIVTGSVITVSSNPEDVSINSFISNTLYKYYYTLQDSAGNYYRNANNEYCINTNQTYTYDIGNPATVSIQNLTTKTLILNGSQQTITYPSRGERSLLNLKFNNLEIGSELNIYSDTNCSGALLHSETNTNSNANIDLSLTNEGQYHISAKQIDQAGNEGNCSNNIDYLYYKIKSLALGKHHSCFNLVNGDAFCFGRNNFGQIGLNTSEQKVNIPKKLPLSFASSILTAGAQHTCHVDSATENAYCHGLNDYGQLGTPLATSYSESPILVGTGYKSIAAGLNSTCVLESTTDFPYCFGRNNYGQLGTGDQIDLATPTTAASAIPIIEMAPGHGHICYTDEDEKYRCVGQNNDFQLGISGNSTNQTTIPGTGIFQNIHQLQAGSNFNCFIEYIYDATPTLTNKIVKCFGDNSNNRLGDYSYINKDEPVQILSSDYFNQLSVGDDRACAVNDQGKIKCWGAGFLGIETLPSNKLFKEVQVGSHHICAISTTNEIYCRGQNQYGQLGNGTYTSSTDLTRVEITFDSAELVYSTGNTLAVNSSLTPILYDYNLNDYPFIDFDLIIENRGTEDAVTSSKVISNSQFSFVDGVYPGTGGDCAATIPNQTSCTLKMRFKPTESNLYGIDGSLKITYNDNDFTRSAYTRFLGYSKKILPNIKILSNGIEFNGVYEFNTALTSLNATTNEQLNKVFELRNDSSTTLTIQNINITGNHYQMYKFNGGSFPGTNGNCTGTLIANTTCNLDIAYAPTYKSSPEHTAELKMLFIKDGILSTSYLPLKGYANIDSPDISFYEDSSLISTEYYFNTTITKADFSDGDIVTKEINIKNTGDHQGVITSQSLIGLYPNQYQFKGGSFPGTGGTCSVLGTLDINESCLLVIQYKPNSLSPAAGHKATFQMNYKNAAHDEDTYTIQLDINGYAN